MANPGDEFIPIPLPSAEHPDYFRVLVKNCIHAYRITLSDSTALDANGVIGKLRPMILDDDEYKRETKIISAQRIINDISELNNIQRELEYEDEEEEEEPGQFDIRNPDAAPKTKKPRKLFDKQQIDLKLKVITQKRDLLKERSKEEEKEGDSINLFFIPVTREEFEKLKTVEISDQSGESHDAYSDDAKETPAERAGEFAEEQPLGRYEEVDGEMTLVAE